MNAWQRRVVGYFTVLFVALFATAGAYRWGMGTFEGRPQTYLDALQFTVEMFTTTGFGGDAPWESAEMQAFIVVTDLLGMALLVGALPVVATPLLERAFSERAPTSVDGLTDHVVICSYTIRAEVLIEELNARSVPSLIVESDRERADELSADGHRVVRANPESTDGLRAAGVPEARALVADVSDRVDASIVLAAKELAAATPVVSVVEDPDLARYHRLAGADHVLSPRPLLGRGLAAKVTTALRTDIDDAVAISDDVRLAEVSVRHGGELAGSTLAASGIREETGVTVVGAWFNGEFTASPDPTRRLERGTVLLVSGRSDQLEAFVGMTQSSAVRRFSAGPTVIVGYGQVGRTVASELEDAGIPYTVIDKAEHADVDVVGDATDPETVARAGVADAETVVLALPDDTTTEFATLVARDAAPETEIIARVDDDANVSKTYRAGADYVLSLGTVTGRMSAGQLLEQRDVLSVEQQVEVVRLEAAGLVGRSLVDANVRGETGCTVMALERDETVITDVGPRTVVEPGDELVIVGTDAGVRAFERAFV